MVLAITIDLLFLVGKPVLEEAGGESKGKNATEAPLSPGSWTGNQFWLSSKKTQADEGYIGGQGSVGQGDHKGQTGKFEPSAWSTAGGAARLHVVEHHRRCLSMWKAICLTLLASSLNNIGKALQKEATGSLPRFSLSVGTVSQYLRSRTWLIGLAADVGGAVLMLAALALAPERLRGSEWAAVAVAAAGGMVLGVSAQDTASAGAPQTTLLMVNNGLDVRHVAHSVLAGPSFWSFVMLRYMVLMLSNGLEDAEGGPTAPGALRVLAAMSLLVGTVLGAVMAQLRRAGAAARPVSPRQAASTCGLLLLNVLLRPAHAVGFCSCQPCQAPAGSQTAAAPARQELITDGSHPALKAGACFGLSAAASRTGFMLASRGSGLWTPAGILCSVALSAAGVLTQTRGLKDGNSVVVCTCAAVSSMASGVLAGLVALGEPLPATLGQRSTRLLAWLLIIAGVGALGAGPAGHAQPGLHGLVAALPNTAKLAWGRAAHICNRRGFLAETARAIFRTVPVQVWAVLPTWWSVWLQQQVSPRADHLPLHGHTETLSKQRSLHRPSRIRAAAILLADEGLAGLTAQQGPAGAVSQGQLGQQT
eukprot:jgi/Astpho2/7554/Aster-02461